MTADLLAESQIRMADEHGAALQWADAQGRVHEWTFDGRHGYALVEYKQFLSRAWP